MVERLLENKEFRELVYRHLPYIDEVLTEEQVPIYERFTQAAFIFVKTAVIEHESGTEEDIFDSDGFRKILLPICNDWYFDKYGPLAHRRFYEQPSGEMSGIATSYAQPLLLKIPKTTITIEKEGETVWLNFLDHLEQKESIKSFIRPELKFDSLSDTNLLNLKKEIVKTVHLSRSIYLNFMSIDDLDKDTSNMSLGVWNHFEKAVSDVLSLRPEIATNACWELHLAIEKTLKVFIKQHNSAEKTLTHDLIKLVNTAKNYGLVLDDNALLELPKDKEAIKFRYAELITSPKQAAEYYKNSLHLVKEVSCQFKRRVKFNNTSFLIKKAPWAR